MSAILGVISNKNDSTDTFKNQMMTFDKYKFDRIDYRACKNTHFACFHQEVTEESVNEILPFYDEESQCFITADAILDNREELCNLLNLKLSNKLTDSKLILESYRKWGYDCPKYLYGDFAFAIYNSKIDELIIAKDQLGKRSLYYSYDEHGISFSTIMEPLINGKVINKNYAQRFLAIGYIMDDIQGHETIYNNVYHVKPAHIMIYRNGDFKERKYWTLNRKKIVSSIEEQVKQAKQIFEEAVKCRLRTNGDVGVLLSGGLDSSAVACVAAPILNKSGKNLNSYTVSSSSLYDVDHMPSISIDETDLVQIIQKRYSNIKLNFFEFNNKDSYSEIDEILNIIEQPYKFFENSFWYKNITAAAGKDGCRVLLDGQFGNLGISYSNIDKHLYLLLKELKLFTFYKDMASYCRKYGLSKKKVIKKLFTQKLKKHKNTEKSYFNNYSLVDERNMSMIDNFFASVAKKQLKVSNRNNDLEVFTQPIFLNNLGAIETKFGLKYNLMKRDPTRDVRVIECCYNTSPNVYNYLGGSRMLIKLIMKDIVPEEVLQSKVKGLQSADWKHRIKKHWDEIFNSLTIEESEIRNLSSLIDIDKYLKFVHENKSLNLSGKDQSPELRNMLIVLIFGKFINSNQYIIDD